MTILKSPVSENHCFTIVKIQNIISLENKDNIVQTNIYGVPVVVSKNTQIGEIGVYIPYDVKLSEEFCFYNNLNTNCELNYNNNIKGYIEKNRRVKSIRFTNRDKYKNIIGYYDSQGLYLPLKCLEFTNYNLTNLDLKEGDIFDELNGSKLCEKYIITGNNGSHFERKNKKYKFKNKLFKNLEDQYSKITNWYERLKNPVRVIYDQFNFHDDTSHLNKNLFRLDYDTKIAITEKVHGTSAISANVLVNRPLTIPEYILKKFGVKIQDKVYDPNGIYASRKVVKNKIYNSEAKDGWYGVDVWGIADKVIRPYIKAGETIYYEIVGYLPGGKMIQKDYDYGLTKPINDVYFHNIHFEIYVYRITSTNYQGKVIDYSHEQVKEWCKLNNFKHVDTHFYGTFREFLIKYSTLPDTEFKDDEHIYEQRELFLELLKEKYWLDKCYLCNNDVPNEGVVVRIDEPFKWFAYKWKNILFTQYESKLKDDNDFVDIEDTQLEDVSVEK